MIIHITNYSDFLTVYNTQQDTKQLERTQENANLCQD